MPELDGIDPAWGWSGIVALTLPVDDEPLALDLAQRTLQRLDQRRALSS